ncbi:MAG: hypothetical protein EON58_19815 [Alphaproteobacteria bacterium]|nr:MAG: hypothetical protein EON58_19815 [Alphaproteobacteria bacterium]
MDSLYFTVSLVSMPRGQGAWDGDVMVKKFVVTDDLGNIIQPIDPQAPAVAQRGTTTIYGTTEINSTTTSLSSIDTITYSTDSDGNKTKHDTSGTATTYSYQTEYQPWSKEAPYYYASYTVRFPLFKPDGQPYVTAQTKTLTLHIITEAGERITEYKLKPPRE